MAGKIQSNQVLDADLLKTFQAINVELTQMVNSLDVQLRKAIPVLNQLKVDSASGIKAANEALKQQGILLNQKIQADKALLQLEAEQQKVEQQILKTAKLKEDSDKRDAARVAKKIKDTEKLNDLYALESQKLNGLIKTYRNLVLAGEGNTEQAKRLQKEITELDTKLKQVDATTGKFQRKVGEYPKTSFLTTTLGVLSGNLLTRAFSAVTTGIKNTITLNKEFEKSIANLSAITGATGADLDFYSVQAKKLGQATKGGAVAVVEAFKLIGSAKPELLLSKEALVDVTKSAILLSKAAGLELPDAATRLTDALNQFGAPAKDAGKFVDILAAGAKAGAAEVPEITDALLKFGVAAKSSNITIQESVGAIELLAEKGLKGAEAGTALRNVFSKLSAAKILPREALGELQKAGVNIATLANNSLPLSTRLKELGKIQGNAAAITRVFGLENKIAGEVLIANVPRLEELTKAVDENGVAMSQAETNTNTYEQAVSDLGGAWDTLVISLTEGNGILKSFINDTAAALRNLNAELALTDEIEKRIGKNELPGTFASIVSGSSEQTRKNVSFFNEKLKEQSGLISNLEGAYVDLAREKLKDTNVTDDQIKLEAKRILLTSEYNTLKKQEAFRKQQIGDRDVNFNGEILANTMVKDYDAELAKVKELNELGLASEEEITVRKKLLSAEISDLNKGIVSQKKAATAEEIKAEKEAALEMEKIAKERAVETAKQIAARLKAEEDYRNKIRQLQINAIADERKRGEEQAKFDYDKELQQIAKSTANETVKGDLIYHLGIELRMKLNKLQDDEEKKAFDKKIAEIKKINDAEESIRAENFAFQIENEQANFEKQKQLANDNDKKIDAQELANLEKLLDKTLGLRKQALRDKYLFEVETGNLSKEELLALENKYNNDVARLERDALKTKEDLERESRESILAADKAALEKRKEMLFEYLNKAIDLAEKEIQKTAALKQKALDDEIGRRERAISVQQALAERGQKNTLAFEEAQLAKEQQRKVDLQKQEEKKLKAIAFLKLLSGYAEKDPNTALQKALVDTALASVIAGAFYEGTEKVSEDLTGNKSVKDGYIVRVDGSERVMTGKQNAMVGDMSNEDLARLAYDYNNKIYLGNYAQLSGPTDTGKNIYDSAQLNQLVTLNKKIENLEAAIKSRPVNQTHLNNLSEVINTKFVDGFKLTTKVLAKPPRI